MVDQHVRRSGDDYAQAMANLLPSGPAWPREPTTILQKVIKGLAQYWGTVDGRIADLLETESDPRLTFELLEDWLRNFGLPASVLAGQSDETWRKLLVYWMTLEGSPSRQFFIDLAARFGFTISIVEYSPFVCGISRCGDTRPLNTDDPKLYRWQIGPIKNRFVWRVTALNSSASLLELLFKLFQPAHTAVVFNYYAVAPIFSPAKPDLKFSTTAPNIYYAILSPKIVPPRYGMSLICYPPDAVLLTRVLVTEVDYLQLTTTPPVFWHGKNYTPAASNFTLSMTAPTVVKTT